MLLSSVDVNLTPELTIFFQPSDLDNGKPMLLEDIGDRSATTAEAKPTGQALHATCLPGSSVVAGENDRNSEARPREKEFFAGSGVLPR